MTTWMPTLKLALLFASVVTPGAPAYAGLPASVPGGISVSVMTYNVQGLPWPLATGRDAAFARMAARLSSLRKTNAQPHVIVLQEAFTYEAKQIAARSGYRFIANGPSRDQENTARGTLHDEEFAGSGRFFKGETSGKFLDSGLQIASDYPILSVRRAAFPGYACAGYDCLANKGVLLVTISVPGSATPITVATTHMNSKRSSGVSQERSLYAYQRQVAAIGRFIAANRDPNFPIIFAGDFNASNVARRSYLISRGASRWSRSPVHSGLQNCVSEAAKRGETVSTLAATMIRRGLDWQFYAKGVDASVEAVRLVVPFGHERDGTMLSDHVGYGIIYRVRHGLTEARRAT